MDLGTAHAKHRVVKLKLQAQSVWRQLQNAIHLTETRCCEAAKRDGVHDAPIAGGLAPSAAATARLFVKRIGYPLAWVQILEDLIRQQGRLDPLDDFQLGLGL